MWKSFCTSQCSFVMTIISLEYDAESHSERKIILSPASKMFRWFHINILKIEICIQWIEWMKLHTRHKYYRIHCVINAFFNTGKLNHYEFFQFLRRWNTIGGRFLMHFVQVYVVRCSSNFWKFFDLTARCSYLRVKKGNVENYISRVKFVTRDLPSATITRKESTKFGTLVGNSCFLWKYIFELNYNLKMEMALFLSIR